LFLMSEVPLYTGPLGPLGSSSSQHRRTLELILQEDGVLIREGLATCPLQSILQKGVSWGLNLEDLKDEGMAHPPIPPRPAPPANRDSIPLIPLGPLDFSRSKIDGHRKLFCRETMPLRHNPKCTLRHKISKPAPNGVVDTLWETGVVSRKSL